MSTSHNRFHTSFFDISKYPHRLARFCSSTTPLTWLTRHVVVGGGLIGCVIPSRLSQNGKDVIQLEAGPDPTGNPATEFFLSGLSLQGSELDYAYSSDPVPTTANRLHYDNFSHSASWLLERISVYSARSVINNGGNYRL
ncbi:hypothetical protein F4776DRAFT_635671 [Hypoxylon sp. NC0597]|nr:hypothetical protein F4776DRAFT_635671 [Hypoxylon sp. NC0597]